VQEQAELVGFGSIAGGAVGGKMVFQAFDVVLCRPRAQ
jgi:hypothetical protein